MNYSSSRKCHSQILNKIGACKMYNLVMMRKRKVGNNSRFVELFANMKCFAERIVVFRDFDKRNFLSNNLG